MTLSGPSAAATCLTFKTQPAASLYTGIPQILFFWIYKILSVLEFSGALNTTWNPLRLIFSLYFNALFFLGIIFFIFFIKIKNNVNQSEVCLLNFIKSRYWFPQHDTRFLSHKPDFKGRYYNIQKSDTRIWSRILDSGVIYQILRSDTRFRTHIRS